jgi:hypothetical protein
MPQLLHNRWFIVVVAVLLLGLLAFLTINLLSSMATGKSNTCHESRLFPELLPVCQHGTLLNLPHEYLLYRLLSVIA